MAKPPPTEANPAPMDGCAVICFPLAFIIAAGAAVLLVLLIAGVLP